MRTRAAAAAAILALSLLAACGDDDDDTAASDNTEESGSDASDVEAAVERAQLELEDLDGEGWELTSATPPDDGEDEPNPLDDCLTGDIDERMDDAKIAESEERTFSHEGDGFMPLQVTSSSVGLDDPSVFDDMHELLRDEEFAACFTDGLEEQMAQSAGDFETTIGTIEVGDGLDPDDHPGVDSTAVAIPLTIEAQGLTVESRMTITILSTGQVGSSVLVFGPADEPVSERAAELAGILADRLAG